MGFAHGSPQVPAKIMVTWFVLSGKSPTLIGRGTNVDQKAMFCVVLCVWCHGVRTRCRRTILFLTAKDQCELLGHRFNPIKIHKLTMQTIMAIFNTVDTGELIVVEAEEV